MKHGKEQGAKSTEQRAQISRVYFIVFLALCPLLLVSSVFAQEQSVLEAKLTQFIRQIYNEDDDIRVKFTSSRTPVNEKARIRNISFLKMPDANGDGICNVEVAQRNGQAANMQVPFKVFIKKKVFVMKNTGKKGDVLSRQDVVVRETYHNGKSNDYPITIDDVIGRVLKRDINANTVITKQVLEEQVLIQRGDLVNIVAQNKRLLVQARGRTLDKGKMGDSIRVKNLTSGKEIVGRVASGNTVIVQF